MTQTPAQALTAQQRIEAMRQRAQEHWERKVREKARAEKLSLRATKLAGELREQLYGLRGLPVRRPGDPRTFECSVVCDFSWPPSVTVGCQGHVFQQFQVWVDLTLDEPVAYISHDDDPITPDVAIDLALASVEAALAVDDNPAPADEPPF